MRFRIWALMALLPVILAQRLLPTPPHFRQRFNRDQLNGLSSSEESNLPQPPLFMTSPSFSFDDVPPTTTTPTSRSLTVSPSTSFRTSTRPAHRRPFVKPVKSVNLRQFRPTPRSQLPVRPRLRPTTSQLRPATQPPLRRIQLNPAQTRPRFQPAPSAPPRRPAPSPQRTPPIQVQPASARPPPVRRPSPTPALQIRPLTQSTAPRAQPFNRTPPQSRPPPPPAFTPGVRSRPPPSVPRPTQPLPPPSTVSHSTAQTSVHRPVPQSTPHFSSTNSVGPSGPPNTRLAVQPHTPQSAHPPGKMPPNNFVVDELNRAEDFMAVAARLKLRRFARHRNRRRADFILQQQLKNR